jgi:RNA recognition motif-containing protein
MPPQTARNAVYDPYGYSSSNYAQQTTQGGYGQVPQGYNAPYANNYGNVRQSYGAPHNSYSNEYNQQKPRGRFIAGEMLNEKKVFVRGLPYRVTAKEIEQFFYPLEIVEIKTGVLADGRASGDGIIEFNSEADAKDALSRDKKSIKTR